MATIYRQLAFHRLTAAQQQEKLRKDSEYEIAHLNLSAEYKRGKLTKAEFDSLHDKQWKDYEKWSIENGLYEEVTPEQQLAEAENNLTEQVKRVNEIRTELKLPLIETKAV